MKSFIKVIIAGAVILVLGIGVLAVALGINGWQIDGDYEMKTFECQDTNTTLDIDFAAGTLEINKYDGQFIKIEYPENSIWSTDVTESNGTVSVATTGKFRWNNIPSLFMKIPTTKIWIPQGDILNIKLDMDAGTVKFAEGEYGDFIVAMNAGTFLTQDIVCKKLSVEMNAGTISIKDVVSEQNVNIDLNAGAINVQSLVCPALKSEVSAGSVNINKLQTSYVDVDVNAGSLKLGMTGAKSDYNIDVDKSAGSCNISNQNGSTDKRIKAEVSAGSLVVKFDA
ncbi:MAG: DUF4097 domain-containing protein [Clostridia bacterium]|nr:DUF4097 domain-containing protein [Clostridia bacterium]